MDKHEILADVQEIFRDILDNNEIVLSLDTKADEIEEWDSLSHIQLVVAIEKKFKVRFLSKEIMTWSNVGEMIECIQSK